MVARSCEGDDARSWRPVGRPRRRRGVHAGRAARRPAVAYAAPRRAVACPEPSRPAPAPRHTGPPVSRLSYSALGEYARCGYRFYAERVLGLPPLPGSRRRRARGALETPAAARDRAGDPRARAAREARLPPAGGADRRRRSSPRRTARRAPRRPSELGALIRRFAGSELCARLAAATDGPPRGALRVPAR